MNKKEVQVLINAYQQTNPSPAELEAFVEGLVYYASQNELSGAESLQLAIDQMETDQRQEVEDGYAGISTWLANALDRKWGALDEMEWAV